MRIRLDLSAHCIETELKHLYNTSIAAYFKADEAAKNDIERTIDVVARLLTTVDFPRLRAIYPPLAGRTHLSVALSFGDAPPAITPGAAPIRLIAKSPPARTEP